MTPNAREAWQILGVVSLMLTALIFLTWLFAAQPAATEEPVPVRENTVIIEIEAPENVRCFAMINRMTNEPEDFTCVTTETQAQATSGVRPHQLARTLTF